MRRDRSYFGGHALAAVLIAASLGAPAAHAAEYGTGPWVKGYTDIFGGIVPPQPGLYVRNDMYATTPIITKARSAPRFSTGMFSSESTRDISPTSWQ